MMLIYASQSIADWLFITQSRVLQADWMRLENNEKATLNINMPYLSPSLSVKLSDHSRSIFNPKFV